MKILLVGTIALFAFCGCNRETDTPTVQAKATATPTQASDQSSATTGPTESATAVVTPQASTEVKSSSDAAITTSPETATPDRQTSGASQTAQTSSPAGAQAGTAQLQALSTNLQAQVSGPAEELVRRKSAISQAAKEVAAAAQQNAELDKDQRSQVQSQVDSILRKLEPLSANTPAEELRKTLEDTQKALDEIRAALSGQSKAPVG